MNFDTIIDRFGTSCAKWDMMENIYGVPAEDGLAMWVADTDFRPPQVVLDKMQGLVDHGIFGYVAPQKDLHAAIAWWMKTRHDWQVDPDWIFTTTGLINAVGLCLDAFTKPDDGIVLFTPVYHVFAKVIRAAGRQVVECPLVNNDGRYEMDFDAYDAQMTGNESMVILCSPHNPGGRVWTRAELQGLGDFCKRHDLKLISDEIHHDLVFKGHKHLPMTEADRSVVDRTIILTAPSKTFNIAGLHNGNVIIEDDALRAQFGARMAALAVAGNTFGQFAAMAAYSPEGAEWVDAQMAYLDRNRQMLDQAIDGIPGLSSMPLESTFLAWVDFSDTGMTPEEFTSRVEKTARIAVNHGGTFGTGGEMFLRFNFGTQASRVAEACKRLTSAFGDLQ
ncbi:MAG: pyridoxal phosphate-dependent aminotransferase [Rhodobacteraceae bacterium]|nr:pyridoxal phosphate-dependent aminotransferase [Paracoccaceae bacterium]